MIKLIEALWHLADSTLGLDRFDIWAAAECVEKLNVSGSDAGGASHG